MDNFNIFKYLYYKLNQTFTLVLVMDGTIFSRPYLLIKKGGFFQLKQIIQSNNVNY